MGDEIGYGSAHSSARADIRTLIPMEVEGAVVWIEQNGSGPSVDMTDEVYTVGLDRKEVFGKAIEVVRATLSGFAQTVAGLKESVRPDELSVEFALSFEVEGTASIIPVLLTGSTSTNSGFKVTAVWKEPEGQAAHDRY